MQKLKRPCSNPRSDTKIVQSDMSRAFHDEVCLLAGMQYEHCSRHVDDHIIPVRPSFGKLSHIVISMPAVEAYSACIVHQFSVHQASVQLCLSLHSMQLPAALHASCCLRLDLLSNGLMNTKAFPSQPGEQPLKSQTCQLLAPELLLKHGCCMRLGTKA